MAKVSAFKGWRYNHEIIDDLKNVIVPPYDVITPEEQNQYYDASPHNYIRINLNNTAGDEKYSSACLLYTSPSPRDRISSRMPSSA